MHSMEKIQYAGLDDLNAFEREILDKIAPQYYEKYTRYLQNEVSLKIHLKSYSNEGKQKKFSINIKVSAPTKIFESSAADWDFSRTLHKSFKDIENQLEHHFKKA